VETIDWRDLADTLETITLSEQGHSERGGTDVAKSALTLILGDAALRDAVDFYVAGGPGSETARSVLWMLRPPAAMERCREIILTSDDEQEAADAANLLQVVADRRVFDWLPELLASRNPGVRAWTVGIIDQLVIMTGEIELDEAMPLLDKALVDPAEQVKDRARQVLEMADHDARLARAERPAA
jgi:hypothetical protein